MKSLLLFLLLACGAQATTIKEPAVETARFTLRSPDDDVKTLGKVAFFIDLASAHDTLFELKLRRAGLRLADGRAPSAFGYHQQGGVVVIATAPVTKISVTGVSGKKVLAIFYNANNDIIAPRPDDVRVFDLTFKPLGFAYTPARPASNITMDVSILIDRSGSMVGHMQDVVSATRSFMSALPSFTRCWVLLFGTNVEAIATGNASCPQSLDVLSKPIMADGTTSLFSAIENSVQYKNPNPSGVPHLVIAVTDGVNTESHTLSKAEIIAAKQHSNARVLVFWAGAHDPEHLKGIADHETVSGQNINSDLDAFFNTIGISVSGIQTLVLH